MARLPRVRPRRVLRLLATPHRSWATGAHDRRRQPDRLPRHRRMTPTPRPTRPLDEHDPIDVLARVLANDGADKSATETIRATRTEATSISPLRSRIRHDRLSRPSGPPRRGARSVGAVGRTGVSGTDVGGVRAAHGRIRRRRRAQIEPHQGVTQADRRTRDSRRRRHRRDPAPPSQPPDRGGRTRRGHGRFPEPWASRNPPSDKSVPTAATRRITEPLGPPALA
jgi:hypothetical protein